MRCIPTIDQAHLDAIAELSRDKQDDDWSGCSHFEVEYFVPFLSDRAQWIVTANGYTRVGKYDTYKEATIVKAKLEYRRSAPIHGMIGLDGLDGAAA